MTNQQHPITPPPELVHEWNQEVIGTHFKPYGYSEFIATRAAQWGADQELEACCEWIEKEREHLGWAYRLNPQTIRAARRPKPPSLKEQALAALEQVEADFNTGSFGDTIRRALEALDDD